MIEVVTPSISSLSGGVGPAVIGLYKNYVSHVDGAHVCIRSLLDDGEQSLEPSLDYAFYRPIGPASVGFSPSMISDVCRSDAELVHSHGVWMATSCAPLLAAYLGKRVVVSPHGMLDEWILKNSPLKKRFAKSIYEGALWRRSTAFIALNESERSSIHKLIPNKEVYICPNGIDMVPDIDIASKFSGDFLNCLFIGRIHPKKNIISLVRCLGEIPREQYCKNPFKLRIAGWGEPSHIEELLREIGKYEADRFEFLGPVFGHDKLQLFRRSDIFLLPSHSEGLPVAVLEAWANGLMVGISDQCNLQESFSAGVAHELRTDVKLLYRDLVMLFGMSRDEMRGTASRGFEYVSKKYSWSVVAHELKKIYQEILGG